MQTPTFGPMLKEWRTARRVSQLGLALEAGVSARHLSYVETGRARPSREMVARLADSLELPLRERNSLLVAAGFAPRYRETPLAMPALGAVNRAIEMILRHQEPYPAFVLDRRFVGNFQRWGKLPSPMNRLLQRVASSFDSSPRSRRSRRRRT